MDREPATTRLDIDHAEGAFEVACTHWVEIGAPFLRLPSGRRICGICAQPWASTPAERRALFRRDMASGLAPTGTGG
jgi:hypothetical protein